MDMRYVIKGEKLTIWWGDKVTNSGTLKLDTSRKPIQADLTIDTMSGGGTKAGVIELSGKTMRMAFSDIGKPPPRSAKNGKGVTYLELQKK